MVCRLVLVQRVLVRAVKVECPAQHFGIVESWLPPKYTLDVTAVIEEICCQHPELIRPDGRQAHAIEQLENRERRKRWQVPHTRVGTGMVDHRLVHLVD